MAFLSLASKKYRQALLYIENSVHIFNDSTLVNDNRKVLDNSDLLSLNSMKPVDSNTLRSNSKFKFSILSE